MKATYTTPLTSRYTSPDMQARFSDDRKFGTWRRLWFELARAQNALGLPAVKAEHVEELERHMNDPIDYELVARLEKVGRHDVMAHIGAFGELCPTAKGVIHLGATSMYVCDNTDLILMKEGLEAIMLKLAQVIHNLAKFARKYKDLPCLGFTHLMPAQLVTVGKRACMWIDDLLDDLDEVTRVHHGLKFLGCRGATGTSATFLKLFEGDGEKVHAMEEMIAERCGFDMIYPMTGQTYSRKVDTKVLRALAGIAESLHKMNRDLRDLMAKKEIDEPSNPDQHGSSAMPYKRNPMTEERICSLARHLSVLQLEPALTHMLQGFERTLDDSAGRRIYIPEAFLTAEAVLLSTQHVLTFDGGLVVFPKTINRHVMEELPFMATEEIMMAMVEKGADRQVIHGKLKAHALAAGMQMKQDAVDNDLIQRISADPEFAPIHDLLNDVLDPPRFTVGIGDSVEEYLADDVAHALLQYEGRLEGTVELKV